MRHSVFLVLLRSQGDAPLDASAVQDAFIAPASAEDAFIHLVTDDSQLGIDHSRSAHGVSAFLEIVFEDAGALASARSDCERVAASVEAVHPNVVVLDCAKNVVVPLPAEGKAAAVKRMSLLEKRRDIEADRFRHEWTGKHARDVPHLPHLVAYTQNITERSSRSDNAGIDGIVELWFPTPEHIVEAFASDQAKITQGHALEFIQTITTFLVSSRSARSRHRG